MKQRKLIVGNWKMNPESKDEARKIASDVKRAMKNIRKTNVVICPPFVYLSPLSGVSKGNLFLGAQNANAERLGALTGEVSFSELYQFNVRFVILGHSERRKMGETDEIINKKIKSVVSSGLNAIVCVGESVRDRNGDYFGFIRSQIHSALKDVNRKFLDRIIIAYEPLWAIGAKEAMQPRDLLETSIFIRKVLKDSYGSLSESIQILYGGAVDKINCAQLIEEGNVSGFLVGRESLRPKDFIEIIKIADQI